MPELLKIEKRLQQLKEVERVDIVGSARRRQETIGDVDILIISNKPKPVMDFFVNMPEVARVYAQGETKSMIKLKNGMDVDLRVVPKESYGAALQYFTGSKEHNVEIRQLAIKKGYKLNEYGLFKQLANKKWQKVAGEKEEEIYQKLGMEWIPPEIRENRGEIESSLQHKLPKLIDYKDLMGDLQIQTNWSDGSNTIEDYANEAIKMGLKYIVITDHTKRLAMAHGLNEEKIFQQAKEIDKINNKFRAKGIDFKILKGSEVDILKDGSLDIADDVLKKLDVVGGSIHSYFNLSKEEQTKRLIKAMENKNVDIIFHPTCRIINKRPAIELDINEIIKTAKKTGTILEINAFPDRLDLKDEYIKKCIDAGVKLAINSDAHSIYHLHYLEWGIAQARRGWVKKTDIINAWPLEKMLKMLK
jgi:DNA polymerase (family 10)